jgi:cyclopropane-fatty-acyl-phospholipid synthase
MLEAAIASKIKGLPLSIVLPSGVQIGTDTRVVIRLKSLAPLKNLVAGNVGHTSADYVEGRLDLDGNMHDIIDVARQLLLNDPTAKDPLLVSIVRAVRTFGHTHSPLENKKNIQFHYDVSDEFFKLWLDESRAYSCAYFADPSMSLAEAQQAKFDHVCRKLMLQSSDKYLDVGCGWGGLLLHAAENYGVDATGITLSQNQFEHVSKLIKERGLSDRVRVHLIDYRLFDGSFDKISSIGMFEHVGTKHLPAYFAKLYGLLKPGGLLLNHGITAGGTTNARLSAGMGDFIEKYIFPGGELQHISHVLRVIADAQLETLDVESLRPHYARTLWAWSDALERKLEQASTLVSLKTLRAYRIYLAGCALGFEQGWTSIHQMLVSRPSGDINTPFKGAQTSFPFTRKYMYR